MKEKRRHKNLPEVVLPEELRLTADLKEAMAEKDILVLAVPSVYIRATAARMKEFIRYGQIVINVSKGIEESSLKTMSQVIEEELPEAEVAVLSGPSHARGGKPRNPHHLCGGSSPEKRWPITSSPSL